MRNPHAPTRCKQYLVGCMLIDAINEVSALKKYSRIQAQLKKAALRERAARKAWLDGCPVQQALRLLASGQ